MPYTVERVSNTGVGITVQAPYEELERFLAPAAKNISEATEIEGFRRGHAPYEVVKARVGEFKILEEASRLYIERNFERVLKEVGEGEYGGKSFEPVGEPQVTVTKLAPGEELEFKITLTLLPAIELPDYPAIAKRILATRRVPETTEREVLDAIAWLCESRAKLITVNRGAQSGDRVEIDFSASSGGAPITESASKDHPLILGKGRLPTEFEAAITGMEAGEEKTFSVTLPADWRDRALAGKSVQFRAKMNLVQERRIPAFDDAFAEAIGGFSSASAAEANIREGLAQEKKEKERERVRMAIAQGITDGTKAEIPDALVERELEKMTAELADSVAGMGLALGDYLAHIKKSVPDLKREWRGDALRRVKIALVLREIAKCERLEPSEAEVQEVMNRTIAHRGLSEEERRTLDPVRGKSPTATAAPRARASNGVDREAFMRYHAGVARNEKVFQWLESQL